MTPASAATRYASPLLQQAKVLGWQRLSKTRFRSRSTTCTIPFGNVNLVVGAPRAYRSGIHNGLDFNCGTTDHVIESAAAGQVIFVVNDYVNASPEDREAVLAQTVPAFDTPFWTLADLVRQLRGYRPCTQRGRTSGDCLRPPLRSRLADSAGCPRRRWHTTRIRRQLGDLSRLCWHRKQRRFSPPALGTPCQRPADWVSRVANRHPTALRTDLVQPRKSDHDGRLLVPRPDGQRRRFLSEFRNFSIWRRSRLVGRPAPLDRSAQAASIRWSIDRGFGLSSSGVSSM